MTDTEAVLIVGARQGSLGEEVRLAAKAAGFAAVTAGVSGEELGLDLDPDIYDHDNVYAFLEAVEPRHIVCTVGINDADPEEPDFLPDWYRHHFNLNAIAPMLLLATFAEWVRDKYDVASDERLCHYVAVSSNSAFLPRTRSAAYCASKAALSQALRVKGREAEGGRYGWLAYGYEPGLLAGTPMTQRAAASFSGPLHRMRGPYVDNGLSAKALAHQIVTGLIIPGPGLNGTLVRYDNGEM